MLSHTLRRCAAGAMALALTALSATSLAAPANASTEQAPADESTMRIATSGQVDNFNPFTSIYLTPTAINRYVYENLVQYDSKDFGPTEGLAESWDTSDDGKEWTYKIREGMKWSDDEPITADDVVYTYTQMMEDPAMGAANGSLVQNFDSVEATDEHTVAITLKEPQAPNPGVEIPIVPEHIWSEKDDPAGDDNDTEVVGSGPYTLESYEANQSITLKANPNFWRGAPKVDTIQYAYYTNSDAQVQALRAGDVDFVTGVSPEQLKALEGADNVETNIGESRRFTALGLNSGAETPEGEAYGTGAEALKDVKVRQALRLGIDMDTLREQVMQDYATEATSFVPESFEKWHLPKSDKIVKSDPEAAKKLLDEAGWTEGSDGIREKDGEKLSLRLLTDAQTPTEQTIGEFLTPWMKDIGVELKVESSDSDTISDRTTAGDYDMYITGWSVTPDPEFQLSINTCASRPDAEGNGPTSQDGYCSETFDELYAKQHTELDESKRIEYVHQALQQHYDDVAQITLWYPNQLEAFRSDRFTGFTTQPTDGGVIGNQSGYWGFLSAEPAAEADAGDGEGGLSPIVWVGIGIAVLAGAIGIPLALRRRNSDDRA